MKLLLIEDDRRIANALREALAHDHLVSYVGLGLDGLKYARNDSFDIVVLDLTLPDISGIDVCQALREAGQTMPILVITGEGHVMNKIKLLDAGADDYLTKPFSLGEFKARLRVLERRSRLSTSAIAHNLTVADLTLQLSQHRAERAGQLIPLRRKELALLECLLRNVGSVVSRSTLAHYAWPAGEQPWANTIDVHIKYLRDKIDKPFDRQLIKTIHGVGYKLETPALAPLEASEA